MRVLGIDIDTEIMGPTEMFLKSEGFNYYHVTTGKEGVELARHYPYDVILLNAKPSDISGIEVVRLIRSAKVMTPVIMLAEGFVESHEVEVLKAGADDYLTKPFKSDVLVTRIRAVIRRSKGHTSSLIEIGPLALNLDTKKLLVHGTHVHLTKKEYRMVELLVLHKGITISKERFLDHLYGGENEPEEKIIDVFICKLRKKLARASHGTSFIGTVWGQGYVINDDTSTVVVPHPAEVRGSRTRVA